MCFHKQRGSNTMLVHRIFLQNAFSSGATLFRGGGGGGVALLVNLSCFLIDNATFNHLVSVSSTFGRDWS